MRIRSIGVLLALAGAGVFVLASGNHEGSVNTDAERVETNWLRVQSELEARR